jgi:hypothetical protein
MTVASTSKLKHWLGAQITNVRCVENRRFLVIVIYVPYDRKTFIAEATNVTSKEKEINIWKGSVWRYFYSKEYIQNPL